MQGFDVEGKDARQRSSGCWGKMESEECTGSTGIASAKKCQGELGGKMSR